MTKAPSNRSHLQKLISTWQKDVSGLSYKRLQHLIGVTVLMAMLDDLSVDGTPHLAVKGGAAMQVRFGPAARATSDVDAVVDVSLEQAFEEIADRLEADWEGFTGELGPRSEIIAARTSPLPQRAKIKLAYRGRAFITLPFELSWAESNSFSLTTAVSPAVSLEPVQLPTVESVNLLGPEYQVAQKLHACTETPEEGPNLRVRDLYDIWILAPLLTDLPAAKAAAVDTFTHRGKHSWPPALTVWPDWPTAWEGLDIPSQPNISFSDLVAEVEGLIVEIDGAS